ncbi:MAG: phosphodiester glycosidase family protein [Oscillospiraceae bacterium]|nr:phosphodiester glycosidase family protein [Oscillospiraceae bacterium]
MKRILALALCVACLCTTAFAASVGSARVGGGAAKTVAINADEIASAQVFFGQGSVNKDQAASDIVKTASAQGKLLAAVNGGFFNAYYKAGDTIDDPSKAARCYANVVRDGMAVNGCGGDQSAVYLGFTKDGKPLIDEVDITLYVTYNGKKVPTWGVNSYYPESNATLLFTPEADYDLPLYAGAQAAKIVNGKVAEIMTSGTMVCAPNTYYFVCGGDLLHHIPSVGASVSFTTEFSKPAWKDVTTAVSCGPWLLHNGQNVFAQNSKYGYLANQKVSEDSVAQRTFAAITASGGLLLGTCIASPRQVTQYLQSVGATDAMLLDGGASSMLYANGSTLTSAGRRLNNVIAIYGTTAEAKPAASSVAYESTQSVDLDGKKITLPAYKLVHNDGGETNYVRIRDLAQALNGTAAQFDVTWLSERSAVNIVSKHAYDHPNGSEGNVPFSGPQTYNLFTGVTLIDGKPSDFNAFNITYQGGGNTYYQLRDLGRQLGFNVGWSSERGVFIETGKPYSDAD